MRSSIYADFNATSALGLAAQKAMAEVWEAYANPSSAHRMGRKARERLDQARSQVAEALGFPEEQLVFTSGGSEANTLALLGLATAKAYGGQKAKILASPVEHSSVMDTLEAVQKLGHCVRWLKVKPSGALDFEDLNLQLQEFAPDLVSVMVANNETGIVYPVSQIAELCHKAGAKLHADAVQGLGRLHPQTWQSADLVSFSGHKVYGPTGVGVLRIARGLQLAALHFGGSQEIKRRGGTENLLGAVGMGAACATLDYTQSERVLTLRKSLESALVEGIEGATIAGAAEPRLPNTTNLRVPGIPSEVLLGVLDMEHIYVSAGSACSSGSTSPSHVLLAMGMPREQARECLRISLGPLNTQQEVDTLAEVVINHVSRIRARRGRKVPLSGAPLQATKRSLEKVRLEPGHHEPVHQEPGHHEPVRDEPVANEKTGVENSLGSMV